jgi:signal transduction histidine kinase
MIRSIFGRLLLAHIAVILLTIITLGLFMSFLVREHVIESRRRELLAKGYTATTLIAPVLTSGRLPYRLDILGDLVGGRVWLVNQEGKVVAGDPPPRFTRAFPEGSGKIEALFAGTPQSWVRSGRNQADPSIIVALPVTSAATPTALFVYTPITGINQTIAALDKLFFYSLLLGMLAAIILALFISRSLTRPIANIAQAAAGFARGEYGSRTTATNNDEIGKLGQVFNSMADSLAHIEQNRRDFLANVSHELKTPVASIQALAEALHDGMVSRPEEQQRYLTTIVAETQHIDRLIRDLLDLAQLEAGELTIVREAVDLAAFLPAAVAQYDHMLHEKSLQLQFDIPADLPRVLADPGRLSQVLVNLISNAVRYSPVNAAITVSVRPDHRQATVAVSDHGPGIPLADQPYIWDRFYRVDKSRSRAGGGTGLGLAITKRLVQAMGGTIAVASTPGEGATFTFTLPLAG